MRCTYKRHLTFHVAFVHSRLHWEHGSLWLAHVTFKMLWSNPTHCHKRLYGKRVTCTERWTLEMIFLPIKFHVTGPRRCRMPHSTKKPVTTMLTYPWKCTVLHCNHVGNTWKPLVLITQHFDYCPSASEGDNQSVRSSAPVVSRCFPGGYNVKLYISRGRLAWWLLAFLHSARYWFGT